MIMGKHIGILHSAMSLVKLRGKLVLVHNLHDDDEGRSACYLMTDNTIAVVCKVVDSQLPCRNLHKLCGEN